MYIELTKAVGLVMDGESTLTKDPSTSDKIPTSSQEKTDEAANPVVTSTGRQRFGDTRTMKCFKLDDPILVEYQQ